MTTMTCLHCGRPLGYLGILKGLLWLRCLSCGLSQACAVCPACAGQAEVYDEETETLARCQTCGGSGLRTEVQRAEGAVRGPLSISGEGK